MTPITNQLLAAYRRAIPARKELASVDWHALPELLRALGCEACPDDAAMLTAGIGDGSARSLLALRLLLVLLGDRAYPRNGFGGFVHCGRQAAAEMCSELVSLIGAALSLLDVSSRVAAGLDVGSPS
jgi:hypothetical protein